MPSRALVGLLIVASISIGSAASAQGVRSRMRPKVNAITPSQATELTLTLTAVTVRPVQVWIRTAGRIDASRKVVTTGVSAADAAFVQVDQRVRAFPVESRSSMYQARVVRVVPQPAGRARVDVELLAAAQITSRSFVVEIIAEPAWYLSVPNEAIIEEGDSRVVYVQTGEGQYEPRTIKTGLQGELYTQVLDGVKQGEQVVTFGSFFIDSNYKLKGNAQVGRQ
jgi:membrane fusion protein, copper/silver efflux system